VSLRTWLADPHYAHDFIGHLVWCQNGVGDIALDNSIVQTLQKQLPGVPGAAAGTITVAYNDDMCAIDDNTVFELKDSSDNVVLSLISRRSSGSSVCSRVVVVNGVELFTQSQSSNPGPVSISWSDVADGRYTISAYFGSFSDTSGFYDDNGTPVSLKTSESGEQYNSSVISQQAVTGPFTLTIGDKFIGSLMGVSYHDKHLPNGAGMYYGRVV